MNKFIKALCLSAFLSICAFAQTQDQPQTTTLSDEPGKNEYYAGFSYQRTKDSFQGFNGFEGAYVRRVHRFFGIKGDVSGTFNRNRYNLQSFDNTNGTYSFRTDNVNSKYDFLGGIQVKDGESKRRLRPFGHALAGVSVRRYQTKNITCTQGNCPSYITNAADFSFTRTGFSAALGGGLDIKINDKFDFRAIQVDYNPVYSGGYLQNNFRFGIGIVIK